MKNVEGNPSPKKRWHTLEELEALQKQRPKHVVYDRYGPLPTRRRGEKSDSYRSTSIDHIKNRTGGRNRKERRGS